MDESEDARASLLNHPCSLYKQSKQGVRAVSGLSRRHQRGLLQADRQRANRHILGKLTASLIAILNFARETLNDTANERLR